MKRMSLSIDWNHCCQKVDAVKPRRTLWTCLQLALCGHCGLVSTGRVGVSSCVTRKCNALRFLPSEWEEHANSLEENVLTMHGVCVELLDLIYLRYNWVYDRLRRMLSGRLNKRERYPPILVSVVFSWDWLVGWLINPFGKWTSHNRQRKWVSMPFGFQMKISQATVQPTSLWPEFSCAERSHLMETWCFGPVASSPAPYTFSTKSTRTRCDARHGWLPVARLVVCACKFDFNSRLFPQTPDVKGWAGPLQFLVAVTGSQTWLNSDSWPICSFFTCSESRPVICRWGVTWPDWSGDPIRTSWTSQLFWSNSSKRDEGAHTVR